MFDSRTDAPMLYGSHRTYSRLEGEKAWLKEIADRRAYRQGGLSIAEAMAADDPAVTLTVPEDTLSADIMRANAADDARNARFRAILAQTRQDAPARQATPSYRALMRAPNAGPSKVLKVG